MALITRCACCGSIWILPDRQTANGPVRCSECLQVFNASLDLLEIDDSDLDGLVMLPHEEPEELAEPEIFEETEVPAPVIEPDQAAAPDLHPSPVFEHDLVQTSLGLQDSPMPLHEAVADFSDSGDDMWTDSVAKSGQKQQPEPEKSEERVQQAAAPEPIKEVPLTRPAAMTAEEPSASVSAETDSAPVAEEPAAREETITVAPKTGLGNITQITPQISMDEPAKESISSLAGIVPGEEKVKSEPASPAPAKPVAKNDGSGSSVGRTVSILVGVILVFCIAAACSIIFNQQIIRSVPQTAGVFDTVCRKINCPGFYLHDISSFVVSKTNLRALDESGNYILEVTIINGSGTAQAVPHLDIELVDDNEATLLHRTISPEEYLDNPQDTVSMAPDRSMTVRVGMQTNVTPAKCIVKPVYP